MAKVDPNSTEGQRRKLDAKRRSLEKELRDGVSEERRMEIRQRLGNIRSGIDTLEKSVEEVRVEKRKSDFVFRAGKQPLSENALDIIDEMKNEREERRSADKGLLERFLGERKE